MMVATFVLSQNKSAKPLVLKYRVINNILTHMRYSIFFKYNTYIYTLLIALRDNKK